MKIVLATANKGKIKEFEKLLIPLGMEVSSLSDIGFDKEIEETGTTFEENSFIKAKTVSEFSGYPAIADDSGLRVDFLEGEPGVYTARFGGENLSTKERNDYLLELLKKCPDDKRTAQFVSVITMYFPDKKVITGKGKVDGIIAKEQKGENGFAYDKVFLHEKKTFAEHSLEYKNKISHRALAIEDFRKRLKKEGKKYYAD